MEKYNELMNQKINFQFNSNVINSFKITAIRPTERFTVGLEGNGRIFNCDIDWENKEIGGAVKIMEFPESVFKELQKQGYAENPVMAGMSFKCLTFNKK